MRTKPELTEFGKFLERQREEKKLGTQETFANDFGISRTHYINVIQGRSSFSIETCIDCVELLRDATLSHVLRLNGLGKLATYIEKHYGPSMTPNEVKVLDVWRNADDEAQAFALRALKMKKSAEPQNGGPHATTPTRASAKRAPRRSRKR